jgi:hypothetical protein
LDDGHLDLTDSQRKQAERELERCSGTVDLRLREAYCWLFVPEKSSGTGDVEWEAKRLTGSEGTIYDRASKKLVADEQLIPNWSPALLKMELDRWNLWGDVDHISTKKMWEYLATYLYLPRMRNRDVLQATITEGVASQDFFGYAAAYDGNYRGLAIGKAASTRIDSESVLVKADVATANLAPDSTAKVDEAEAAEGASEIRGHASSDGRATPATATHVARRFWSTVQLDAQDAGIKVSQILESIIEPLLREHAKVKMTLEIEGESENGFSEKLQFDVGENCDTLKIKPNFEQG